MYKLQFLAQLRKELSGLPQEDLEERLTFYSEMVEDRMEEGLSEEDAVAAVGSVEKIAAQIAAETPLAKNVEERILPKRQRSAGEIVLLVLGAPIWLSLGLAVFAVFFSLYILLWTVIVSLWAVFASFAVCSVGGVLACVVFAAGGNGVSGVAILAAAIVCAGLSIFMFYGCKAGTGGILILTKKITVWIQNCFIRKGAVQ